MENNPHEQFYDLYQKGVAAPTLAEREKNINEALTLLLDNPEEGGTYDYNLGNSYYLLEEYPWALYYYLKAEARSPRDQEIKMNIERTAEQLQIPFKSYLRPPFFSHAEELWIAQVLIGITFLVFSLFVWTGKFKKIARVFLGFTSFIVLAIALQFYLTPDRAVLAQAAFLIKDPKNLNERVFLEPLPPGTLLEIIGKSPDGEWIKVVQPNGIVGFVPSEKLLLL